MMTLEFVPSVQIINHLKTLGDIVCYFETTFLGARTAKTADKKEKRRRKNNVVKLKTVKRLLPVCSNCNRIRDNEGYWRQLEGSILDRPDKDFTHGICPQCARKLYPEYYDNKK
jgi:hypothetical protein